VHGEELGRRGSAAGNRAHPHMRRNDVEKLLGPTGKFRKAFFNNEGERSMAGRMRPYHEIEGGKAKEQGERWS